MNDIGSIVIPVAIMLILASSVTACMAFYFRCERYRADALASELEENRKLAANAAQQQEDARTQLAQLTDRVGKVEELLRSVG